MHLEVEIIPVSDVDRSKEFYQRLGWRLDDDVAPLDGLRIVQFTPPGSAASVTFGTGLTTAAPGSAEGGLIVSDIEAAHDELAGRGIDASEIWHGPPFPARVAVDAGMGDLLFAAGYFEVRRDRVHEPLAAVDPPAEIASADKDEHLPLRHVRR
jgi:catechol 2,3-dioxygenase-like lactoylglutathione lyase family enzyme